MTKSKRGRHELILRFFDQAEMEKVEKLNLLDLTPKMQIEAMWNSIPVQAWLADNSMDACVDLALAKVPALAVRFVLASNPNLDRMAQLELSKDKEIWVRYYLAQNPYIDFSVQCILARDACPGVRGALARNPSIVVLTQRILEKDKDVGVRNWLAYNPSWEAGARDEVEKQSVLV